MGNPTGTHNYQHNNPRKPPKKKKVHNTTPMGTLKSRTFPFFFFKFFIKCTKKKNYLEENPNWVFEKKPTYPTEFTTISFLLP